MRNRILVACGVAALIGLSATSAFARLGAPMPFCGTVTMKGKCSYVKAAEVGMKNVKFLTPLGATYKDGDTIGGQGTLTGPSKCSGPGTYLAKIEYKTGVMCASAPSGQ